VLSRSLAYCMCVACVFCMHTLCSQLSCLSCRLASCACVFCSASLPAASDPFLVGRYVALCLFVAAVGGWQQLGVGSSQQQLVEMDAGSSFW
jgi:hypothetical protein